MSLKKVRKCSEHVWTCLKTFEKVLQSTCACKVHTGRGVPESPKMAKQGRPAIFKSFLWACLRCALTGEILNNNQSQLNHQTQQKPNQHWCQSVWVPCLAWKAADISRYMVGIFSQFFHLKLLNILENGGSWLVMSFCNAGSDDPSAEWRLFNLRANKLSQMRNELMLAAGSTENHKDAKV